MTCVVGIVHQGSVWIGADSAGVGGWELEQRADEKVFRNGPYLLGFTTSFRMGDLLRYQLDMPVPTASQLAHPDSLRRFMVTTWIDAVRECLSAGGYARKTDMVGIHGQLFRIDNDYQVGLPALAYSAVGCGAQIALGSLYSTAGRNPGYRCAAALEAAEQFSIGVRGPFIVRHLAPSRGRGTRKRQPEKGAGG